MRKSRVILFLGLVGLVVLLPLGASAEKSGKTYYTFTGSYNPQHRTSPRPVPAQRKQAEAFWAAYCNIAVNLARLQNQRLMSENSSGWVSQANVGGVEVLAMASAEEGEQAVCRAGNFFAIFTQEGELKALFSNHPKKMQQLRQQKWPASLAGIKIISVRYLTNCESEDCECEMTVEYP